MKILRKMACSFSTVGHSLRMSNTATAHIATVTAFENKNGSFSYAIRNEETREVTRASGFKTLCEARNAVRQIAWDTFGAITFAPMARKGEYLANAWK
jgi:hypothetical protein